MGDGPEAVRARVRAGGGRLQRHGPLLRAISEAAAEDERDRRGPGRPIRERFADLVEAGAARRARRLPHDPPADVAETARALNLMNEDYLLDVFGREPRVSAETASRP